MQISLLPIRKCQLICRIHRAKSLRNLFIISKYQESNLIFFFHRFGLDNPAKWHKSELQVENSSQNCPRDVKIIDIILPK